MYQKYAISLDLAVNCWMVTPLTSSDIACNIKNIKMMHITNYNISKNATSKWDLVPY